MNKLFAFVVLLFVLMACHTTSKNNKASLRNIPPDMIGNFKDDYGINYTINDSVWIQHSGIKYHLLKYDKEGQFFIAKNDVANPSEAGLYTRIDVMHFTNMEPFLWGFCLTAYNAKSFEEAVAKQSTDRNNPKKGCGGYPFSRMKKVAQ